VSRSAPSSTPKRRGVYVSVEDVPPAVVR
jgi:hypothetical protein